MLMTGKQYKESLEKRNLKVHLFGERVRNVVDHPLIRPSMNAVALTYDLAHRPEHREIMTAVSHLTGQRINRFTHIHQSPEDLFNKQKMTRLYSQEVGGCIQRCMGIDSLNALSVATFDADQKYGTKYNEAFINFMKRVQAEDLALVCAQTDVK